MEGSFDKRGAEYKAFIKTGERRGMGTDLPVFIALHDQNGLRSDDFELNSDSKDVFKHGKLDSFDIVIKDSNFGDPIYIELWRDHRLSGDAWYCEFIRMENIQSKEEDMFPVHRWIRAGFPVKLKKYDTLLPQDDPNMYQRRFEIEWQRAQYQPVLNELTGMLTVRYLPSDESFFVSDDLNITQNKMHLNAQAAGMIGLSADKWDTMEDIERIYKEPVYSKPMSVENWREDRVFGSQRLSGCNPNQIRLCIQIPKKFAVEEKRVEAFLDGLTIQQAISAKRLFIIDYQILKDLPCTGNRKICAPLALFFVNKEKHLVPVAIQLFQIPSPDNPVFYPSDPEGTWLMAKCYFNLADGSFHESATHLGFTHLIGEIIVIATHRSLSPSHPIFRLLAPHFMYLLAINKRGMAPLLEEGGFPDIAMNIGRVGMAEIIRRQFQIWRLDVEGSLLADLNERGVADPEVLPDYHYRDDALLLHEAISNYVSEIVYYHYENPEKIAFDNELQEWCRFLGGESKLNGELTGGIKGLPNGGHFETAKEIATVVTDTIFILSAGHASVNFGQYHNYGFPPAYPVWMDGLPPHDKTCLSEEDILKQLPSKMQTAMTMAFAKVISTRGSKPLGDFEMQYIYDPTGLEALDKFRAELKRICDVIDARNETRQEKYIWLHPSEVPNSITI